MALFEVFIPSSDSGGFHTTLRVEAQTWTQALSAGLQKTSVEANVESLLCDVTENGMEVTDPASGAVFRIVELEGGASAPPPAAAAAPPPAAAAAPPPAAAAAPPPAAAAAPPPAAAADHQRFSNAGTQQEVTQTAATAPTNIGRGKQEAGASIEDLLGELFERSQGIYDHGDVKGAADFILNLANESIPSESGAVFSADINTNELEFLYAYGPKADAVQGLKVPMGTGFVGYCAHEGVALAVSDVERDPRFFRAISDKIGYSVRSILCAPVQKEGRVFGALELVNKTGGNAYSGDEMSALNYLAHQLAEYMVNTDQTGR